MLNRTFSQAGRWLTSCAAQVFRTLGFKLDLSVSNISPLYTLSLLPPAQYWRLKILRRRFILHNSSQLLCCLGNQINLLLPQTEYTFSDKMFSGWFIPVWFFKIVFCHLHSSGLILHYSSQLLCCLENQIDLLLPRFEYILSDKIDSFMMKHYSF